MQQTDPDRLALIGHSLGAAGAIRYLRTMSEKEELCPFQFVLLMDLWPEPWRRKMRFWLDPIYIYICFTIFLYGSLCMSMYYLCLFLLLILMWFVHAHAIYLCVFVLLHLCCAKHTHIYSIYIYGCIYIYVYRSSETGGFSVEFICTHIAKNIYVYAEIDGCRSRCVKSLLRSDQLVKS